MKHLTLFWQRQLVTISANTTCRQLVNRFVTTCLQTVTTCAFLRVNSRGLYSYRILTTCEQHVFATRAVTWVLRGWGGGGG
jgi:hypothetical protein